MATIYQTELMGEADLLVALVDARGEADLLVKRVASEGMAHGDAHWFITRNKQDANTWICVTGRGVAQVRIFFVDSHGEAGWQSPSRFQGRLR